MRETWVRSLSWEDPLEKEMATWSSILSWRIPWTEEPGGLQSMGHKESDTTERLNWTELIPKLGLPRWLSGKDLPAVQETWIQSLNWEDPLEKEMATHSSILAWEIPWTEEPGRVQSMGLQRVRRDSATKQQQQNQILSYHFLLGIGKITQSFLWQCWLMYTFLKIII